MKKLCVVLFIVSCLVCTARAEESAGTKGSLPPPEKGEMKMGDLKAGLVDLDGKIIATIINFATSFEQVSGGQYRASCGYYHGGEGVITPTSVLLPEEGKELFQALAKRGISGGSRQVVYLQVRGKRLEAVGTRYSKSKGEYCW